MAESYPSFRAGQKVTGALLDSMKPVTARKTSDTARTSTTQTADPEITFEVEANAVYRSEGILYVSGTVTTDDINIDWDVPSGSTGAWGAVGPAVNATTDTGSARLVGSDVDQARSFGTDDGGASNPTTIHVRHLLITGSTAGTFALSWGLFSGAGTATIFTDSFVTMQRIA